MNEREMAFKRRAALVTGGCSTYILRFHNLGMNSYRTILCCCCGQESYNPKDIDHRYCPYCHAWHSDTFGDLIGEPEGAEVKP